MANFTPLSQKSSDWHSRSEFHSVTESAVVLESHTAAAVVSPLNRHQCEDRTPEKTRAALVVIRWRSKTRIASQSQGSPHRHMRKRWSTVIPQRNKQRVGVDLIAGTSQKAAAIIAADVISTGSDRAAVVEDVFPYAPAFKIVFPISIIPPNWL